MHRRRRSAASTSRSCHFHSTSRPQLVRRLHSGLFHFNQCGPARGADTDEAWTRLRQVELKLQATLNAGPPRAGSHLQHTVTSWRFTDARGDSDWPAKPCATRCLAVCDVGCQLQATRAHIVCLQSYAKLVARQSCWLLRGSSHHTTRSLLQQLVAGVVILRQTQYNIEDSSSVQSL
jgi:hypothetical protein